MNVIKKPLLITTIFLVSFALNLNNFAAAQGELLNCTWQPGYTTWRSTKWDIAFEFPDDWQSTSQTPKEGISLSKSGVGYCKVSPVKLPAGETLEKFSRHLIEKSHQKNWDLKFRKDLGTHHIGNNTAILHQYRHKKNRREYTGYVFINETRGIGVQILTFAASPQANHILRTMVESLRFSSATTPPLPKRNIHIETQDTNILITADTITIKTAAVPSHAEPRKANKRPGDGQPYCSFPQASDTGNLKGHVFLKGSHHNKIHYPVYIAFFPLEQISGKRTSKDINDFKVAGNPLYTATDSKGDYRVQLPGGRYAAELYNSQGELFLNISTKQIIKIKKSSSKKLHHFKISK